MVRTLKDYFKVQKAPTEKTVNKSMVNSQRIEPSRNINREISTSVSITKPNPLSIYDFSYVPTPIQTPQLSIQLAPEKHISNSPFPIETPIREKIQALTTLNRTKCGFVTAKSMFVNTEEMNNTQQSEPILINKSQAKDAFMDELDDDFFDLIINEWEDNQRTTKNIATVLPPPLPLANNNNIIGKILGRSCQIPMNNPIHNDFDDDNDVQEINNPPVPAQMNQMSQQSVHSFFLEDVPESDEVSIEKSPTEPELRRQIVTMNSPRPNFGKKSIINFSYVEPSRMEHLSQSSRARPPNSLSLESPKLERKKLRPTIDELIHNGEKRNHDKCSTVRTMPKPKFVQ